MGKPPSPKNRQLVFDLAPERAPSLVRGAANQEVTSLLAGTANLLVIGVASSGKTRFAEDYARARNADLIFTYDEAKALLEHASARELIIDDLDMILREVGAEEVIFHLFNRQKDHGVRFVAFASAPLDEWSIALPDLASRLATLIQVEIEAPDDAMIQALYASGFYQRGFAVSPDLLAYLTARSERSYGAIEVVMDRLCAEAKERNQKLSRHFARTILESER